MNERATRNNGSLSRRRLLQQSAAIAGGAALSGGLVGRRSAFAAPRAGVRSQSAPAGTLIIGMEAEISSFDPAIMTGTSTFRPVSSMFDMLTNLFDPTTDIKPDLAESWEIAPDATSVTMKLRPGVKFHDGTDVNADAVVFSFERMLNTKSPNYHGPYAFPPFFYPTYKTSTAVDPMTVKFELTQPDATFFSALVWNTGSIVSPTAAKAAGKDFQNKPIGAGPFKFVDWEKDVKTTMEAFPGYWGGAPKLQTLIWKPIIEEAARFNQLMSGEVDFIVSLYPQFVPAIQANPDLQLIQGPSLHTWWCYLNMHYEPLKNVKVRQALNYAIDKKSLIDNVLKGTAVAANGWSWPDTWSYEPNARSYDYDPEKAKSLLAEAGYPNGFDLPYLLPESGSGMVAPKEIGIAMQADLKKVGVNAQIETMEWISYLTTTQKGLDNINGKQYGMCQTSWMNPVADPGLYVEYVSAGQGDNLGENLSYYDNKDYIDLLAKARVNGDQAQRADLYKQAQKIFAEDAPWIFMFHSNFVTAARKNVQGISLSPNQNVLHLEKVTKS
ncbi:MAG TPA: ABC transporter substrate-binding protein [Thermomicrobiales bacterium]|nr:ABC transporter substrate-binding protein [Thermomicrobiales bacterium]